jgi:hypothetical protein
MSGNISHTIGGHIKYSWDHPQQTGNTSKRVWEHPSQQGRHIKYYWDRPRGLELARVTHTKPISSTNHIIAEDFTMTM